MVLERGFVILDIGGEGIIFCWSENMQLYWRLGLKLKIIHRLLKFNQSQWLKPYIEFNTKKEYKKKRKQKKMIRRKSVVPINEQCYI